VTCEPWDVVVVPFPFVERRGSKRRPAVVLSKRVFNRHGHSLLAMVTTRAHDPWPGDVVVGDPGAAGLRQDCIVRLKLFTLDNRLILQRIGSLNPSDRAAVARQITSLLVPD